MRRINTPTEEEMLKLKAVVLYVFSQCGDLDYFHLFKILYFADREHYARYGRRIIQDTFCALPKGPVPSNLFDAIKIATGQSPMIKGSPLSIIANSLESTDPSVRYILGAKENPDMDELSASDIELLNKSIEENKSLSIDELSEKSHDEAWYEAWNISNASPMNQYTIAKSGGASKETIDFIKENEEISIFLNQ